MKTRNERNVDESKEQGQKRETKYIYNGRSYVEKIKWYYFLTEIMKPKGIPKVQSLTTAKLNCMQGHVKLTIPDINPQQIILHIGTKDLKTEQTLNAK